jgi:hypothetical protein
MKMRRIIVLRLRNIVRVANFQVVRILRHHHAISAAQRTQRRAAYQFRIYRQAHGVSFLLFFIPLRWCRSRAHFSLYPFSERLFTDHHVSLPFTRQHLSALSLRDHVAVAL